MEREDETAPPETAAGASCTPILRPSVPQAKITPVLLNGVADTCDAVPVQTEPWSSDAKGCIVSTQRQATGWPRPSA